MGKKENRGKYFLDLSKIIFAGGVLNLIAKNKDNVFDLNQNYVFFVSIIFVLVTYFFGMKNLN